VANLIAALHGATVGQSWEWTYQNNSPYQATLAGASSVTVSGCTLVGSGCWARFLVTYATSTTFTLTCIAAGSNFNGIPPFKWATGTTTTTFTAAQMTGGQLTVYQSTATTPGSIATATATAMFAAQPNAFVGQQWIWRVINASTSANTMTITADASVTLSGATTYTCPQFQWREFIMTFTTATTATMVAISGGSTSAN
jgi:hypothetical protein